MIDIEIRKKLLEEYEASRKPLYTYVVNKPIKKTTQQLIDELESLLSTFMETIKNKPYEPYGIIRHGLRQEGTWTENTVEFYRIIHPFIAYATEDINDIKVSNAIKEALKPTLDKYSVIFKQYNYELLNVHNPELAKLIAEQLIKLGLIP